MEIEKEMNKIINSDVKEQEREKELEKKLDEILKSEVTEKEKKEIENILF